MFTKPYNINFNSKYGSNRWIVWSYKINRGVYLYSDLEYAHWLIIENDPLVQYFCEQPLLIETVNEENKKITSIPDMYIRYANGSEEIREIKYKIDLESVRTLKQIKIQKEWCIKNNFKYQIMTEDEIKKNPVFLSNLKILSKLESLKDFSSIKEIQLKISTERKTILNITNELNLERAFIIKKIFQLIKDDVIRSNIHEVNLGFNTEVWIND